MPLGKYNASWRKREPLVTRDELRRERASAVVDAQGLTFAERSALYLHELVGCDGLELVLLTNAHLDDHIPLSSGLVIVPCFLPSLEASSRLDDPLTQATMRMHERARFVYDGWLPISDWTTDALSARIKEIDEALSALALIDSIWYSWEPKYSPLASVASCFYVPATSMKAPDRVVKLAQSLPPEDSDALFRSIGWLSQSFKLSEPTACFLFCILAIEALATHIERHASDASPFAPARTSRCTKQDRKHWQESCIRDTMTLHLEADPIMAVESAYFYCVKSIKKLLKAHLDHVFAEEPAFRDLLFRRVAKEKSLSDLRHLVAHGTADPLSHEQREAISACLWDAERMARRYLARVLELAMQEPMLPAPSSRVIYQSAIHGVYTRRELYAGPTDMALLYA